VPEFFDRARRLELKLPLEVRGADSAGTAFADSAVSVNVSSGAVCFESGRRLDVGASLVLEIALPEALRRHFGGEPVYRTRAVVYRVEPAAAGGRLRVVARFVAGGPTSA
jgi:hypothetical protein